MKKLLLLPLLLIALLSQLTSTGLKAAPGFNDPGFANTWNRADKAVEEVPNNGRGYTWGPLVPSSGGVTREPYNGGSRVVQYFDKARMEVNRPDAIPNDLYYVTTGLLVKEMVTGLRQDGDNLFVPLQPAQIQVAGDPNEGPTNPNAPVYASFRNVATVFNNENAQPYTPNAPINNRIDKNGAVSAFQPPEQRLVKAWSEITQHNVADVFVDFANQVGPVWENGKFIQDSVLFGNPTYVIGLPIAEPYWVKTFVNGVERDVLVQLFERRVLTYTPANPPNTKVEMGNVGQHYYKWRYIINNNGGPFAPPRTVTPIAGTPQTAPVNVNFGVNMKVVVRDEANAPVRGVSVTFKAPLPSVVSATIATGLFPNNAPTATVTTDLNGVATAPTFTASTVSGSYEVQAVAGDIAKPASFKLTNTASAPTSVTVQSGAPQNVKVKASTETPLKLLVKDAFNNPVGGVSVTFQAPTTGANGTFAGSKGTTLSSIPTTTSNLGIATAPTFTANCTLGAYNLTATVSGISTPTSLALTNVIGDPDIVQVSTGSDQTTTVNVEYKQVLIATVEDVCGNGLPGTSVTFSAPVEGASGQWNNNFKTTVVSNDKGLATAPAFKANTIAGRFTVEASVPKSKAKVGQFTLNNAPDVPSSITAASGSGQLAPVNATFLTPLRAAVKDSFGNPVPGVRVVYNVPTTGAQSVSGPTVTALGGTEITTGDDGIASAPPLQAGCKPGLLTATASATGVGGTASFNLSVITGAPANLVAIAGAGQSAAILTTFTNPFKAGVYDICGNPVSDVSVSFSVVESGPSGKFFGSFNTTSVTTDKEGIATISSFIANSVTGNYAVSVTQATAGKTISLNLTNTAGMAASLRAISGSGQSARIRAAFGTPLKVQVLDIFGNPVSGKSVLFSAPPNGASGAFAVINTATTDKDGTAIAPTFTANDVVGTYNVTASIEGAGSVNFSLTNLAGLPAAIKTFAGATQSATINRTFATQLKALVTDIGNNPIEGINVTFTAPSGGSSGSFEGAANVVAVATDLNGVATAPFFTANDAPGSYNVVASASEITNPATFQLTNSPTTIEVFDGSEQSTIVGSAFPKNLKARVKDVNGTPLSGMEVTFTAPNSGPSGTFAGGAVTFISTTDADGIATAPTLTANPSAGAFKVSAAAVGAATLSNFNLTNLPAPPTNIAIDSGSPQTAKVRTPFANNLKVLVTDVNNNPVTGATVTFAAPGTATTGTFTGNVISVLATTDATGRATAPTFTASCGVGGPYNVSATIVNGSSVNFRLTNIVGDPFAMVLQAGAGQSAQVGANFATLFKVRLDDNCGNPTPGKDVTFTAPTTGATGTFTNGANSTVIATDGGGVATAPTFRANCTISGATPYPVVASALGVTAVSLNLTNTVGNPTNATATAGGGQTTKVGTNFSIPLQVAVKDGCNNPAVGVNVTFAAPTTGAGGTFTGNTTVQTNASGVANAPVLQANTRPGAFNATVTVAGTGATASFALTNLVGDPTQFTAIQGTPQSGKANQAYAGLQARALDVYNNPVSGLSVTFAAPAGKGSFPGPTLNFVTTTDANGVATSAIFTANCSTGPFTITASAVGPAAAAAFNLTTGAGNPTNIAVTGPSTIIAASGSTINAASLRVNVREAGGCVSPIDGARVIYTVQSTTRANAFWTGTNVGITNNTGDAQPSNLVVTRTALPAPGFITLVATVEGTTASVTFTIQVF